MAIISDKLKEILSAIFGKDVRQALHDGLEAINEETENTTKKQEKLELKFNDLIINAGNSNAEVVAARKGNATVGDRLDKFDLDLNTKATKTTTDNIQTQVNNLVLGAVGSGNNAEVIQARGGYSVLNDRLNDFSIKVEAANKRIVPTFIDDCFINASNGVQISIDNNLYKSTDFIEIYKNFKCYVNTMMFNDSSGLAYYDKFKNFISGINIPTGTITLTELIIPSNAKYIRYSFYVNKGANDITKSYLEIRGDITSSLKVSDLVNQANTDIEIIRNDSIQRVIQDLPYVKNSGNFIDKNGNIKTLASYFISDLITLNTNETIIVTSKDPSGNAVARVSECDSSGAVNNVLDLGTLTTTEFSYTATKVTYLKLSGYTSENMIVKREVVTVPVKLQEVITNTATNVINDSIEGKIKENYWSYALWKILCIGDSLTSGASYGESWGELAPAGSSIDQNYPRILGRMLSADVVNAGFSGRSASDWYNTKFNLYDYTKFDTVVIWLGTNYGCSTMPTDEEIQNFVPNTNDQPATANQSLYLIKLITQIKQANPTALVVLMNCFASKSNYLQNNVVVSQIATKYNLPIIDMSDLSYSLHPELHGGVNNPHFGIAGNVVIANRFIENISNYLKTDPLRCEVTYWVRTN